MKSFLIQREVITIIEEEIEMDDIKESDLMNMSPGQINSFAHEAVKILAKRDIIFDEPSIEINHNPGTASVPLTEPTAAGDRGPMPFGAKIGKTSKYHYCYRIGKNGKFTSGITSKGKKIMCGSYINEIDAAVAVDEYLDRINDTKRKRNRDEYEEIQSLYLQNNKDQK